MLRSMIVVPCYNEARRLQVERFDRFLRYTCGGSFVLVNDGSTDDTLEKLHTIELNHPDRVHVLHLPANVGKAEAVRRGMLHALDCEVDYVGYWDADLSTPLESVCEFEALLESRPDLEVVCGARVMLLGRSVRRQALRHYLGRGFATVAANVLGVPIYDTQCGAKLFRALPHVRYLFEQPFLSRWLFDVEWMARRIRLSWSDPLPRLEQVLYELPLRQWHDVDGSHVKLRDFLRATVELARIYHHYLRDRPASPAMRPPVVPRPKLLETAQRRSGPPVRRQTRV